MDIRLGRRALGVVVALTLALGFALVGSSSAAAYSCSGSTFFEENDGSARSYGTLNTGCTDGRIHLTGWIWDINCNGRSATVRFEYVAGIGYEIDSEREGRGCNNGRTFDHSAADGSCCALFSYVKVSVVGGFWTEDSG